MTVVDSSAMQVDGSTVLVVDDNETGLYAKSRILRQAGFDVIEASNGTDALSCVARDRPRLVVLDVNLPDIDGWEVCRRIKADPGTASVLVLQVSATHVHEDDTVRSLESGADASLTEPTTPAVLVATARALLRARRAEEALRTALEREQAARTLAETNRAAAEAANRAKDDFLATLSHELRSPLGAILAWTTLLRRGHLDPALTQRAHESIDRNARHQVKLIEDLLDVSRIVSGKMSLEFQMLEVAEVIQLAIESIRPTAEARRIEITAELESDTPVIGDASRLQQVVWNLLSNAIKFSPDGGPVWVRCRRTDLLVEIEVADAGKGIDPEFLPFMFERFRQGDPSITRLEGGLGLGLAIVRHIAELHGGSVSAASAGAGLGATFTLRLPLATALGGHAHETLRRGDGQDDGPASLEGVRILVVDDDADSREVAAAILDQGGATVRMAGSAAEGFATFRDFVPDLVITDIAMPREDGFSLIGRIRALAPDHGGGTPALALTALAGVRDRQRILAAGFQGMLVKPVEVEELLSGAAAVARSTRRAGSS